MFCVDGYEGVQQSASAGKNKGGHSMKKITRIIAAGITTAAVGAMGLASAASAYSIYGTGPFSNNSIYTSNWNGYYGYNYTNPYLYNYNNQYASTGSAYVGYNTIGGSAITGAATNWNYNPGYISVWNY
ncbi:MAG: hypothetical protein QG549_861 [Patescibacteria group bacterium]|nr:hypothetical protein [Patescibacteria group bacterium]